MNYKTKISTSHLTYILRNCCKATLPILYKAQEPAAKTGVNTIKSLISIIFILAIPKHLNYILILIKRNQYRLSL